MHIYVAGASREIERAKRVMAMLREAGHTITFDWAAHIEKVEHAAPTNFAIRAESATHDVSGVIEAWEDGGVLVLLHPAPGVPTVGAWTELGIWIGQNIRTCGLAQDIIVSYETQTEPHTGPNIFDAFVPVERFTTDDKLLQAIASLAGALHVWPRGASSPTVLRLGDSVLVRLDDKVDVWTPGTIAGFRQRKNPEDYYRMGYLVTLSDGSEWHILGTNIRPDTGRKDTKPREPEGYR